jgi:hypothetical protein
MASAATGSRLLRDDVLWDEELARIWACRQAMQPAAAAAVRSVLESLLRDGSLEPKVVASARALLEVMFDQSPSVRWRRVHPLRLRVA